MSTVDVETILALTDAQKIQILEGAKELLGPNGEHWTKSCWWGIKLSEDETLDWLRRNDYIGYGAQLPDKEELEGIAEDVDYEVYRRALPVQKADEANVWCLLGALEESAYRLGILNERDASERLGKPVSLQALAASKPEWRTWSVIDVNDNPNTEFEDIKGLIDERLAQLRGES